MIPFYKPPKMTKIQLERVKNLMEQVLKSGQITNGNFVRELEERTKLLHNVDHVIACSSATQGLWIVLRSLKTRSLMVQSFTWKSLQYIMPPTVVYCDIDRQTWLMNPKIRSSTFPTDTKIVTHTFGNTDLAERADKKERVIYDGAYSFGAKLPNIGDATVISLTATKTITCCEGGLILTDDNELAHKIEEIRTSSSRMSEVNAIVGLVYMDMLKEIIDKKRKIFEFYREQLPFTPQKISRWGTTYGYYGCLVPNRDELIEKLNGKIETRIRYEPLKMGFKTTDQMARNMLILPCYPDLDPKKVVQIINGVI